MLIEMMSSREHKKGKILDPLDQRNGALLERC